MAKNIKLWVVSIVLIHVAFMLSGQISEPYTWKNVPIGGGGYITGMKIHPLDANKRYYRTDVGGAYRWNNATGRMEQMIFLENRNLYSVAGIALHPTNVNIVYLAVGRNCSPSQNAILVSTNAGKDFNVVNIPGGIPFWFAANGGRTCGGSDKDRQGTPLEINPHNTNQLYIGTRGKGLYILDRTTLQLTDVPASSIPDNSVQQSIRSVVFHPTQNIVYIAYSGHGVYVGNTITQNYVRYGGNSHTQLQDAIDISISKNANYMLVACKKQGIMKATNLTGTLNWTLLSGYNTAGGEGYLTADCSPHANNVAITVVADWNHINEFQVTTDAGSTWNQIQGSVSPADNNFKWRNDAFASHISQIAFDPDTPQKMHYTSWFSTFSCDNFSLTGPNSWHNNYAKGHEEIVPTDLVAFPANSDGQFLMAGSGDHTGFLFDSDITDPESFATFHIGDRATTNISPLKKSASFDFCEQNPDNLIACVTEAWEASDGGLLKSNDGGLSWNLLSGYNSSLYKKSIVAMSSVNPNNIIALNNAHMVYTTNGNNFSNSSGTNAINASCNIPYSITCKGGTDFSGVNINESVFSAYRNITADRNFGCVFYYYDWNGDFSISTDGGANWCIVNNSSLPASTDMWDKVRLISVPGPNHIGHLWININRRLYHSQDAGVTWVNCTTSNQYNVNDVKALSFGKGMNNTYAALYIYGNIDGVSGDYFYRSDDNGFSWVRITDHAENELWGDNKIIAGDRNVAGRLYATASGQGVLFGDSDATIPSTCDDSEKTINGEFDDINSPSIPDWVVSENSGATMTGTINNWTKAVLDITNPGTFNYDLQLWQDNLSMEKGSVYLIQTDLRADNNRLVTIKLRNRSNGTTYLQKDVAITSTAQDYSFFFTANVTDNDLRLTLQVGGDPSTVYVDHIRMRAFCDSSFIETNVCLGLEGAFNANTGLLNTTLHQLDLLPDRQPYHVAPWNYQGQEGLGWTSADYPVGSVDWVLVSFRTTPSAASEVARAAGVLLEDGCVFFPNDKILEASMGTAFYIFVEHRNHIGVMSPVPVQVVGSSLTFDFRTADSYSPGNGSGQKLHTGGTIWLLFGGDGDQSDPTGYDINGLDKALWDADNGNFGIYDPVDFNLDGDVSGADRILWGSNNGIFSTLER